MDAMPGVVNTGLILVGAPGMMGKGVSVDEGIKNTLFLATSKDAEGITGQYYHDSGVVANGPGEVRSGQPHMHFSLSHRAWMSAFICVHRASDHTSDGAINQLIYQWLCMRRCLKSPCPKMRQQSAGQGHWPLLAWQPMRMARRPPSNSGACPQPPVSRI